MANTNNKYSFRTPWPGVVYNTWRLQLVVVCFLLMVFSAHAEQDRTPLVSVMPYSTEDFEMIRGELLAREVMDNDGNSYVSYWQVAEQQDSAFFWDALKCEKEIGVARYAKDFVMLSEVTKQDLNPTKLKPFLGCIAGFGYKFMGVEGFRPVKYGIQLRRPHSESGQYMPVGASFEFKRKETELKDLLGHIKQCEHRLRQNRFDGVEEKYFSGYIYVSVENYAKVLSACLVGLGYEELRSSLSGELDDTAAQPTQQERLAGVYEKLWRRNVDNAMSQYYEKFELGRFVSMSVGIQAQIDQEGRLNDVSLVKSSGESSLDRVILRVVELSSPFRPFFKSMQGITILNVTHTIVVRPKPVAAGKAQRNN